MFYIVLFFLIILFWQIFQRKQKSAKDNFIHFIFLDIFTLVLPLGLPYLLKHYPAEVYLNSSWWFHFPKFAFLLQVLFTLLFFTFPRLLQFLMPRGNQNKKVLVGNYITGIFSAIFLFLAILLPVSTIWGMSHFQDLTIDQVVYHLLEPMEGADEGQIVAYLEKALTPTILYWLAVLILSYFLLFAVKKIKRSAPHHTNFKLGWRRFFLVLSSVFIFLFGITFSLSKFGFKEVKTYFFDKSEIYEKHYADPKKAAITFPEEKRNLIYIFVESLETTYFQKELGGATKENIMPNLTALAEEEGTINFSHTKQLGGAYQLPGIGFTLGGMVAETGGIPVITQINANEYGEEKKELFPGAVAIGDILNQEGYQQTLLLGSEANFAGRDKYFKGHGNYQIVDYNSLKKEKRIPEDYYIWWGIEDKKLFPIAKEEVTKLADNGQPFNFTMLTADTHFPDGYLDETNPFTFDDQYKNVVAYSDEMIGDFVNWIRQQPFYQNTTIIISGDHLSMGGKYFDKLGTDYQRTVTSLIINSPIQPTKEKEREFSTLDFYPTTLASLNAKIKGERLGLGTNLFSSEKTLMEELGFNYLSQQIPMRSDYYEKKIVK